MEIYLITIRSGQSHMQKRLSSHLAHLITKVTLKRQVQARWKTYVQSTTVARIFQLISALALRLSLFLNSIQIDVTISVRGGKKEKEKNQTPNIPSYLVRDLLCSYAHSEPPHWEKNRFLTCGNTLRTSRPVHLIKQSTCISPLNSHTGWLPV